MKLDAYLRSQNLTQMVFADRVGTTQSSVSKYRRGLQVPRPELMRRIVDATNGAVTPGDFFDFPDAAVRQDEEQA